MKRRIRHILPILMLLLCAQPRTAEACQLHPSSSDPMATVAQASNRFGVSLYKQLAAAKPTANQFMSPYSVFTALAMTSEGAAGKTLDILTQVLGLPPTEEVHAGVAALAKVLAAGGGSYQLEVANAIWPEVSTPLKAGFKETIQQAYAGGCRPLDFIHQYESSRKVINEWVAQRTNNRIKELLPMGSITKLTRLVLTNAIFFKGNWERPFDPKLTTEEQFFLEDGKTTQAQLMHLPHAEQQVLHARLPECHAVALPYKGGELSMLVILPKVGGMKRLEAGLDAAFLDKVNQALQPALVEVWLPKFKVEAGGSIKPELDSLGMGPLFELADFTRMFQDTMNLHISDVFHKGFVEVNELGTEAAAATAVVIDMVADEGPREIEQFRANHPFLFLIQHNASKSILFMGKVMDPTAK